MSRKLTDERIQDLAFLQWFSSKKNADEPLTKKGVLIARDLKSKGLLRFVSHSDGDYVEVTNEGRAALAQSSSKEEK